MSKANTLAAASYGPTPSGHDHGGVTRGRSLESGSLGASERATRAAHARAASGRRRFVDPTTCERDYAPAELEFMEAIQRYKKESGRLFPTWSEVLEVVRTLGYEKSPA